MYSHPRFLRQIIHLDLVGEVRMHNGKNITHCCMEENEKGEQTEEDAGAERRGLWGWPACLLFWQKGPWDLGGGG